MKVTTGKVVGGKVVVEGAALSEGASVTVLMRENGEIFEVAAEEEAELLWAIADADRDDVVSSAQVFGQPSASLSLSDTVADSSHTECGCSD